MRLLDDELVEMSEFEILGWAFFMASMACAQCVADALSGSRTFWLNL